MDETLKAQIRQNMREKDTEDLLVIWKREDNEEWSDEAYEIVRAILLERGVEPPEPGEADDSSPAEGGDDDVYHSFDRAMNLASWAAALSWVFLGLAALLLIGAVLLGFRLFGQFAGGLNFGGTITAFLTYLMLAAISGFLFVMAQAVTQIIYLLLDIEDTIWKGRNS